MACLVVKLASFLSHLSTSWTNSSLVSWIWSSPIRYLTTHRAWASNRFIEYNWFCMPGTVPCCFHRVPIGCPCTNLDRMYFSGIFRARSFARYGKRALYPVQNMTTSNSAEDPSWKFAVLPIKLSTITRSSTPVGQIKPLVALPQITTLSAPYFSVWSARSSPEYPSPTTRILWPRNSFASLKLWECRILPGNFKRPGMERK